MDGCGLKIPEPARLLDDETVAFAAALIDRSAVASHAEAALARPTGRRRCLPVRAVLAALLLLAIDDRPLHLTLVTELLFRRLTPASRALLGVTGTAPGRRGFLAACRRVRYCFHLTCSAADPSPLPKNRCLTPQELTAASQPMTPQEGSAARGRMESFINALVEANLPHRRPQPLPPQAQRPARPGRLPAAILPGHRQPPPAHLPAAPGHPAPRDGRAKILDAPADPPRICRQTAITIAPDTGARHRQDLPFASPAWQDRYATLRNTIEGLNGFIKDPARQALAQPARRRVRGITACALFTALLLMAANLRKDPRLASPYRPAAHRRSHQTRTAPQHQPPRPPARPLSTPRSQPHRQSPTASRPATPRTPDRQHPQPSTTRETRHPAHTRPALKCQTMPQQSTKATATVLSARHRQFCR